MEAASAAAALRRLHREFLEEHPERDVVAGLASFPSHGGDVETLIEKAERAVSAARTDVNARHVIAYEAKAGEESPTPAPPVTQETTGVPPAAEEREAPVSAPQAAAPPEPTTAAPEPVIELETEEQGQPQRPAAPEQRPAASQQGEEAASGNAGAERATQAAATERERRASGAVMPRRLLLTISDAARMAQVNSLIRSAGYEARAAFDGPQALHLLRIERPDLLLLDYDLQGIDGVETIRRLRKQGGGRLSLPVVMLISSNNERARREALELGAHSVLVTPYDPADLLKSVRVAGSVE
jgi:CheY-like chemotaxis protein